MEYLRTENFKDSKRKCTKTSGKEIFISIWLQVIGFPEEILVHSNLLQNLPYNLAQAFWPWSDIFQIYLLRKAYIQITNKVIVNDESANLLMAISSGHKTYRKGKNSPVF